tara:strand:+ start:13833 stop:14225 length:393 start_codon:yes stop_codon:yes gene_type:complete
MANYFIGPYQFISLSQPPEAPRQTVEVESRAGVDDVAVWRTGIKGMPFTVQSVVDFANNVTSENIYRNYEGLVGGNPVQIQWSSVFINAAKYIVLGVRVIEIKRLTIGRGGLNNGFSLLRAEWTLQPVIL